MHNGNQWFYYHLEKKEKCGPFSKDVLCEVILNKNSNIKEILIATPGWKKWERFENCNEIMECYLNLLKERENNLPPFFDLPEVNDEMPPPIPVNIFTEDSNNIITDNQNFTEHQNSNYKDRRKHPRFKLELKTLFVFNKKTFRTKTIDISLGGIRISDPLPESYIGKNISVYLSSTETNFSIKFEATPLACGPQSKQIKFIGSNEVSNKHLEALLHSISINLETTKKIA